MTKITDYFISHTLEPKFVKTLGWTFNQEQITIPVPDKNGVTLFNKFRLMEGDAKFKAGKGSHPTLYPLNKLTNHELYLVEGEIDCARLLQEGIPAVTSTGGVQKFDKEIANPIAGKSIHLVLDNDKSGQSKIPQYIKVLEELNCETKIVSLPPEHKDVSDFLSATSNPKKDFLDLPTQTPDEWIVNKYKDIYPVIKNDDFLTKKYPAKKWLVKPMIRATGLVFFQGDGGVGKTALSYNLAKAVTEERKWMDRFESTKSKVLFLDKENEEIDIQTNLYAQQATSPDIYHLSTARDFMFFDKEGNITEEAIYLNAYVKQNNISVVILDSMVDFFVGNENDSIDTAMNTLAWKQTFPDCAIVLIHHESKPQQGFKKKAGHRTRGSTHIFNSAQSVISFSVMDEENYPERILVEHAKVRGARKQKPFEVEMVIEADVRENAEEGETVITGFKFLGEVKLEKKAKDQAREDILSILDSEPERKFTSDDLKMELGNVSPKLVSSILPELRKESLVAFDISKLPYKYWSFSADEEPSVEKLEKELGQKQQELLKNDEKVREN